MNARVLLGCFSLFGVSACADLPSNSLQASSAAATTKTQHVEVAGDHVYGHASAVYLCGDKELRTVYSEDETSLTYQDATMKMTRTISDAGEKFTGRMGEKSVVFKGKGYDASLIIDGAVTKCEKLTCIPLDAPL